jgi:phage baseplate assembly protein W
MVNFNLQYQKTENRTDILGLAFPMMLDGIGGVLTQSENLGALRDGVIQLIMTSRGARVMRPDYGTDIRKSVFEPMDTATLQTLRGQIAQTIATYEPRVVVQQLNLIPDEDRNTLTISLVLSTKNDLLTTTSVALTV